MTWQGTLVHNHIKTLIYLGEAAKVHISTNIGSTVLSALGHWTKGERTVALIAFAITSPAYYTCRRRSGPGEQSRRRRIAVGHHRGRSAGRHACPMRHWLHRLLRHPPQASGASMRATRGGGGGGEGGCNSIAKGMAEQESSAAPLARPPSASCR